MKKLIAKKRVLYVFLLSMCFQLVILFICGIVLRWFPFKAFTESFLTVVKIYSVPLAVTCSSIIFSDEGNNKQVGKIAYNIALVLSLAWNLLLLVPIVIILVSETDIRDIMKFMQNVSDYGAFIITGVLVYFFSKADG